MKTFKQFKKNGVINIKRVLIAQIQKDSLKKRIVLEERKEQKVKKLNQNQ